MQDLEARFEAVDDFRCELCGINRDMVPEADYQKFFRLWDKSFDEELTPAELEFLDFFERALNRLAKGLPWKLKPLFRQPTLFPRK